MGNPIDIKKTLDAERKGILEKIEPFKLEERQYRLLNQLLLTVVFCLLFIVLFFEEPKTTRIVLSLVGFLTFCGAKWAQERLKTTRRAIRKVRDEYFATYESEIDMHHAESGENDSKKLNIIAEIRTKLKLKKLDAEKRILIKKLKSYSKVSQFTLVGTGVLFVLGISNLLSDSSRDFGAESAPLLLSLAAVAFAANRYYYSKLKMRRQDLAELDFDMDVVEYGIDDQVSYAEKTVRLHNAQLKRFHDINLKQNSWIFFVGVLCIIGGWAIIGGCFHYISKIPKDTDGQLITAILGGVGTILSNFIGVLYLHMHSKLSDSLKEFHTKLVETHKLLMGNIVATKIADPDKRNDTYSELAKSVFKSPANNQ